MARHHDSTRTAHLASIAVIFLSLLLLLPMVPAREARPIYFETEGGKVPSITYLATVGERVYFVDRHANTRMYWTDGEIEGATWFAHFGGEYGTAVGDRLAFTRDGELWFTDGTAAGTVDSGVRAVTARGAMVASGGLLYFPGYLPTTDRQLWRSDGTPAGTFPIPGTQSAQDHLTPFLGGCISTGYDETHFYNLWLSHGTATEPDNIGRVPLFYYLYVPPLMVHKDRLYLLILDGNDKTDLWSSDGTSASTGKVIDAFATSRDIIYNGTVDHDLGYDPPSASIDAWASCGGHVYYVVRRFFGGWDRENYLQQIWRTDGTPDTNVLLHTIYRQDRPVAGPGMIYDACFAQMNGHVYVSGMGGFWRTDGTPDGTWQSIYGMSENPTYVTAFRNRLYFKAPHPQFGYHTLWETDGTNQGTWPVPVPGSDRGLGNVKRLEVAGDKLFVVAEDASSTARLWVLEGEALDVTAQLRPSEPHTLDDLICDVSYQAPAAPLDWKYRWFRDGVELTEPMTVDGQVFYTTGERLSHHFTYKNETWFCQVEARGFQIMGKTTAGPVAILNTPPSMPEARIVPENPYPSQGIGVEITRESEDADDDPLGYEARWYRSTNGGSSWVFRQELSGALPKAAWIAPVFLHEGDLWRVEVFAFEKANPYKATAAGEELLQSPVCWDQVFVGANQRPAVVLLEPTGDRALCGTLRIAWTAQDADGDALRVEVFSMRVDLPGAETPIAAGLAAAGALYWTPEGLNANAAPVDFNGDGRTDAADLLAWALLWQSDEALVGPQYQITVRAYDSKGAMGVAKSTGRVSVPNTLPFNEEGLLSLIESFR